MPNLNARKKTLLFYIHALYAGGAERVWAQLASSFAARGHKVIFAVNSPSNELAHLLSDKVEQITLGDNHLIATLALRKLIATTKPDCALAACSPNNFKLAIASLLAGRPRRTILSYHGYIENEVGRMGKWPYKAIALLSRLTGRTVAVSNALRDNLVNELGSSAKRTRTIYNPVTTSAPAKLSKSALANRPPNILAAGRLTAQKKFDTLIRAFATLPDKQTKLTILGEGPARPQLEKLIADLGLKSRITLPGFIADPAPYFKKSCCFAMPSDRESFSLVILEAFSFGLPVVASNNGGPVELVTEKNLGELVAVGDVSALAAALERQLANPGDPVPRLKHYARFSLDAATDHYDQLIEEIINE